MVWMRFEQQQKASCFDILNPYVLELCKHFRYRNQRELGDQSSAAKFLGSAAFTLGAGALALGAALQASSAETNECIIANSTRDV